MPGYVEAMRDIKHMFLKVHSFTQKDNSTECLFPNDSEIMSCRILAVCLTVCAYDLLEVCLTVRAYDPFDPFHCQQNNHIHFHMA